MGKGDSQESVNERVTRLEQEVIRLTREINNKKNKERNQKITIEIGGQDKGKISV